MLMFIDSDWWHGPRVLGLCSFCLLLFQVNGLYAGA